MRKVLPVALAAVLLLTVSGTAFAAKGGNSGHNGSISGGSSIVVPNGLFGGTVLATVSPAGSWVHAVCSQNGLAVYEQWVASDSNGAALLTLGPTPSWSGGSATCTADAGSFSAVGAWKVSASTTFNVSG